jgi:hypothetical protein
MPVNGGDRLDCDPIPIPVEFLPTTSEAVKANVPCRPRTARARRIARHMSIWASTSCAAGGSEVPTARPRLPRQFGYNGVGSKGRADRCIHGEVANDLLSSSRVCTAGVRPGPGRANPRRGGSSGTHNYQHGVCERRGYSGEILMQRRGHLTTAGVVRHARSSQVPGAHRR